MERIIAIQGLKLMAHVGVPDEERAVAQRLLADIRFCSSLQPVTLDDDITRTVDYFAVSERVSELSVKQPRKLIETLADEIAEMLLREFGLRWIEVTIRKFILPNTEWVSVSTRRDSE
jgi:dihydroneopterin aldolase